MKYHMKYIYVSFKTSPLLLESYVIPLSSNQTDIPPVVLS